MSASGSKAALQPCGHLLPVEPRWRTFSEQTGGSEVEKNRPFVPIDDFRSGPAGRHLRRRPEAAGGDCGTTAIPSCEVQNLEAKSPRKGDSIRRERYAAFDFDGSPFVSKPTEIRKDNRELRQHGFLHRVCLEISSHTFEKSFFFARRVALGSSIIRFIELIVRCSPGVDRRLG